VYELNGLQIRIQRIEIHKDRWVWSKVQTTFFFLWGCVINEHVMIRFNDRLLSSFQGGENLREDILRYINYEDIKFLFKVVIS